MNNLVLINDKRLSLTSSFSFPLLNPLVISDESDIGIEFVKISYAGSFGELQIS